MLAIWASSPEHSRRERGSGDLARPLILVQAPDNSSPAWLQERDDLRVEALSPDSRSVPGDACLAVVLGADGLERIRGLRVAHPKLASMLVVDGEAPAFGERRNQAFEAGASEVVLATESDRLEALTSFFAGVDETRQPRHRVRLTAEVRGARGPALLATLESMSAAGLQLRVPTPAAAGEVYCVSLPLGGGSALPVWGLVRSVAPAGGVTVARLRFVGTLASERAAIVRYLDGLERDTRSTDPGDAMRSIRGLDLAAILAGLENGATPPDWLAEPLGSLLPLERAALRAGAGEHEPTRDLALARTRANALAGVLEQFDPVLEDEPRTAREVVTETVLKLAEARKVLEASADPPKPTEDRAALGAALEETARRLKRAVAARLPHIAADRADVFNRLAEFDRDAGLAGTWSLARKTRNRLLAVAAGLVIGFALVYTTLALVYGPSVRP